ncbi:MAG: glucosamine-6-phosphate deaminase [Chloroflexi bacterium]|nr:glucosamine-6-phosphate deaminase [Chloroflexota bacterium]
MTSQPVRETVVDQLRVSVFQSNAEMGAAAAVAATEIITRALGERGEANVILATGNSQLSFLAALRGTQGMDWSKVNVFHMDEYIGIDPNHPASFPNFLRKNFLSVVKVKRFFPVSAHVGGIEEAMSEYARWLHANPADLCVLGYGENGHLAFNDPPYADFNDPVWVKVVKLDVVSRKQQVAEGHFDLLDEVPTHAVTLTIPALLAAKRVLALVPEKRKANAVKRALTGAISEDCPGSILRRAPHAHLFLDVDSAGTSVQ